jgi:hypothetical protein
VPEVRQLRRDERLQLNLMGGQLSFRLSA